MGEELFGTLKTFGIETALYQAVQNKPFLLIDKMGNSLRFKLLEKILYEYLKDFLRSQVLITTHNDGLLDLVGDLIRKDSIWFTEKDKANIRSSMFGRANFPVTVSLSLMIPKYITSAHH